MFAKKLAKVTVTALASVAIASVALSVVIPSDSVFAWKKKQPAIEYKELGFDKISDTEVSFNGTYDNYSRDKIVIPSTITVGGETYTVTRISKEACSGYSGLTEVVMPDTITLIGEKAFSGCTGLTTVTFSKNIDTIYKSAFSGCSLLQTVDLSKTKLTIPRTKIIVNDSNTGSYASVFSGCTRLETAKLPNYSGFAAIPSSYFSGCTSLREIEIPASVDEIDTSAFKGDTRLVDVKFNENLNLIDSSSFSGCTALQTISIPSTVTDIGGSAFANCKVLDTVTLADGINLGRFEPSCFAKTKIKSFTFPASCTKLTYIGASAFLGCTELTQVNIKTDSIRTFGASCFEGCSILSKVDIPSKLNGIEKKAFQGCASLGNIVLPDTLVNIGEGAFNGCKTFTTITIPSKVMNIGSSTFADCSNMTSVKIEGDACQAIGASAFKNCAKLTGNVRLPSTVTEIGESAFYGCSQLKGINIPSNVNFIGKQAFYNCSNLASIEIPAQVEYIYEGTFQNCEKLGSCLFADGSVLIQIDKAAFKGCSSMQSVNIPSNVSKIGVEAFNGCKTLQVLNIPANVRAIEAGLCAGCTALNTVTVGSEVNSLGQNAFSECKSLKAFRIPAGVATVPDKCFYNCSNLDKVEIGSGVTSIGESAFAGCSKLCYSDNSGELKLPAGLKSLSESSFAGCANVKKVSIPNDIRVIPASCFNKCVKLKNVNLNKITEIKSSAFSGCEVLEEVDFPSTLSAIGGGAFSNCKSLQVAILPEGIKEIPSKVFSGCSSLVYAKIPSSVASIGSSAYASCNLFAIEIPDNVTYVDKSAFKGNDNLHKINIRDNKIFITQYMGSSSVVDVPDEIYGMQVVAIEGLAYADTKVTSVHFPATIQSVGSQAFKNCTKLTTVMYSDSTRVADDAYFGCEAVYRIKDADSLGKTCRIVKFFPQDGGKKVVSVPKTLEGKTVVGVDASAFEGNKTIESVTLPKACESIGNRAFKDCSNCVVSYNSSATVGNQAFDGCKGTSPYAGDPKSGPTPTTKAAPKNDAQIRAFVDRIYKNVMNRQPEEGGAKFWTDELYNFRRTGAEVAMQFIDSDEFRNRGLSDTDFLSVLYRTFFDREPEQGGMDFWAGQLASGWTRNQVAQGFIYSKEWADTCAKYGIRSGGSIEPSVEIAPTDATYAFVERMYTTAMGRASDASGKDFWAKQLSNFKATGESCGAFFFLSDEMNNMGLSDKEFITRLYKTFMDREPEKNGMNFWLQTLSEGRPRKDVVLGFTRSAEFNDKCVAARILPFVD